MYLLTPVYHGCAGVKGLLWEGLAIHISVLSGRLCLFEFLLVFVFVFNSVFALDGSVTHVACQMAHYEGCSIALELWLPLCIDCSLLFVIATPF